MAFLSQLRAVTAIDEPFMDLSASSKLKKQLYKTKAFKQKVSFINYKQKNVYPNFWGSIQDFGKIPKWY